MLASEAGCASDESSNAGLTGNGAGCTASNTSLAPTDGLIADFTASGGGSDARAVAIMGGINTYGGATLGGPGSPTYSTTSGALEITESALATSTPQYVGVVVYFNNCIDASAFTGVQFTISGSFSGCTMQYSTVDSEHDDTTYASPSPHATGPAGAYAPQAQLTASQVTPTPTTISMPFNGAGAPSGGSPDGLALDTSALDRVGWQLTIPAAIGTPACTASLTIDDVKFYH